VEVAPGDEARIQVVVRNPSDIVSELEVVVLGEAAPWADVSPRVLTLLTQVSGGEQAQATVDVTFRPPRPPSAPSGEIPFGIHVRSREGRDQFAVDEGVVAVSTVRGLEAALVPVGRNGRRAGSFALVLTNTGTLPLGIDVQVGDPADRLRFAVGPASLDVPPGQSGTCYVAVRPRELLWWGRPIEHTFTVRHRVRGIDGVDERSAVYEQRSVIPRWAMLVAAIVVVGLVVVVGWLYWRAPSPQGTPVRLGDIPPAVTDIGVSAAGPGAVRVAWSPSPYALSGYLVRTVDATGNPSESRPVTTPDQGSFAWSGLPGGRSCFEVVALGAGKNSIGARPAAVCLDVPAPQPSAPASSGPSSGSKTSSQGSGAGPDASASSSGPTSGTASGGPSSAGSDQRDLQGWFVVYRSAPKADTAARDGASALAAALQQTGARAYLVDGADYRRLIDDELHVVEDGFTDRASAQARCDAMRGTAPLCIVGPPPTGT
jgi:hypothetical protein